MKYQKLKSKMINQNAKLTIPPKQKNKRNIRVIRVICCFSFFVFIFKL